MRTILNDGDYIVTAFAQRASGPGWSNSPIWVIIQSADRTLRQECLQPDEQSLTMITLYDICDASNKAITQAVEEHLTKQL